MHEAEDVIAGKSDVGMHAIGNDRRDARVLEYRRRSAAGGGITAVDNQFHAVFADQLVCGEDRLVGLGLVVIGDETQLLADHAAGIIDVFDRHLGGDLRRLAVGGGESG